MCGFLIIWDKSNSNFGNRVSADELARFVQGIHSHRGPDSSNVKSLKDWIFSFDRLQITGDMVEGAQPYTADNQTFMCFNGEVFNYQQLAKGLDLNCDTLSDTRVLFEVFSRKDIIPEIKSVVFGQFAFAVCDTLNESIVLSRDSYGEKPIYFYNQNDIVIISSELYSLKKVLEFMKISIKIDFEQLSFYLSTGFFSAPRTIFKDVQQVAPGHQIRLSKSESETIFSDSISDQFADRNIIADLDEATFEHIFMPYFTEICRELFKAENAVGILFSGGIDSTLISLVAKQTSTPFMAHTIGFPNTEFDESSAAREIANRLGFKLNIHKMCEEDAFEEFQNLIKNPMDPIGDLSVLPTRFLSRKVAKFHKVAIGGDGADELFAGYHRMHQFVEHIEKSNFKPYLDLYGKPYETAELLDVNLKDIYDMVDTNLLPIRTRQSLRRYEIKGYLSNNILHKIDRSSMAYGLEVRSPFLDLRLIGLLSSLNVFYKSNEHSNKFVIRKYLSKFIKSSEAFRPKMGFTPPLSFWLHGPLKPQFLEIVENFDWQAVGLKPQSVKSALLDFYGGNDRKLITVWQLFMIANFLKQVY